MQKPSKVEKSQQQEVFTMEADLEDLPELEWLVLTFFEFEHVFGNSKEKILMQMFELGRQVLQHSNYGPIEWYNE